MKRLFLFLLVFVLLFSMCGCKSVPEKEMTQTFSSFVSALKIYDRDAMTLLLTEFPDNTSYIYLDDIFNDEPYMKLYRNIYPNISYSVVSAEGNHLVVKVNMPNVQKLFTTVTAMVMAMVMDDASLKEKLAENDENAIILNQELMLAMAGEGKYEMMEQEYTLSFDKKDGEVLLVCDDQLRSFMTGNFFLSKNMTVEDIANS